MSFDAIDNNNCGKGSTCEGWSLKGVYKVNTSATGSSSLEVDALVRSQKPIAKTMFGVGWGIGYGPNDSFTESFVALYSWMWQTKKYVWSTKSI